MGRYPLPLSEGGRGGKVRAAEEQDQDGLAAPGT